MILTLTLQALALASVLATFASVALGVFTHAPEGT